MRPDRQATEGDKQGPTRDPIFSASSKQGTDMSQSITRFGAARTSLIAGGLCLLTMLHGQALAEGPELFMVEEDWEMTLNEPEPNINSPQVAFFLYPDSDHADCYFQLQMNYAAEDAYSSGGFRVGAFCNEVPVDEERSPIRQSLAWDNDHIEWTSAMAVFNGQLMFAVKDGYGMQWGHFGGPEYLVQMDDQNLHCLDHYTPQKSLESVDIGFGANRVASIRLKTVRLTYTDGHTTTIHVNQLAH